MKTAYLLRTEQSDQGTFGHLCCEDFHLHTGELPWRDNKRDISCIPAGSYMVEWEPMGYFKGYVVKRVADRDDIEIHIGNFCGDTERELKYDVKGCICLGLKRGKLTPKGYNFEQEAVISSSLAMERFHSFMNKVPFILFIEDKFKEEEYREISG